LATLVTTDSISKRVPAKYATKPLDLSDLETGRRIQADMGRLRSGVDIGLDLGCSADLLDRHPRLRLAEFDGSHHVVTDDGCHQLAQHQRLVLGELECRADQSST